MNDIKFSIKAKGYTLEEFAEEVLGIKRNALYKKINGDRKFTKLEKEKIKEVLNIEID
ncbi:helix-turn-helix transcriptional regulator [Romboutsia sp.]|uniref:helix-turn-helix domain-containing protein n=1 Tax=Romboutsia sp. TaxID=1965302 RepID=UPI002C8D4FC2|nr:helix-turn-helix transcriptional regulator [Romboutsia sp.]HSQ90330.1 helix-turn-helix transcriptional regulator [Romboutsia sp.]